METAPRLPQEIIDIIIDDDSHGPPTHKVLALVSKSFLLRSRRHFFRDVRFEGRDKVCRALQSRFSGILNDNPDIASYVRKVYIEDYGPSQTDEERPSWIREEETFQGILLVLAKSQITDLTLDIDLGWTSFPTGLQHALTQILTTPSLVNLDISDLKSLPVSCCTQLSRLKHLRISRIILAESEEPHQREAVAASISSLEVASLRGRSAQLFRNILGLGTTDISLSSLETFTISNCDADVTREVILATRKSLRRLTVSTQTEPGAINLSELECLNCLVLKAYWRGSFETSILGVLETGGPNTELHSIHIRLHEFSYRCWADYLSHSDARLFWRRLATLLDRFSNIVDLGIKLSMFREDTGDLKEEQRAALEGSVRNGLANDGEKPANVNRVLLVEISEL